MDSPIEGIDATRLRRRAVASDPASLVGSIPSVSGDAKDPARSSTHGFWPSRVHVRAPITMRSDPIAPNPMSTSVIELCLSPATRPVLVTVTRPEGAEASGDGDTLLFARATNR